MLFHALPLAALISVPLWAGIVLAARALGLPIGLALVIPPATLVVMFGRQLR